MFIHIFVFMSLEHSISQSKFDSEHEKLMINVIYSANLLNLITSRLFKPYELSPQQYNVLRILRGQKGEFIALMDIEYRMLDKSSNVSIAGYNFLYVLFHRRMLSVLILTL